VLGLAARFGVFTLVAPRGSWNPALQKSDKVRAACVLKADFGFLRTFALSSVNFSFTFPSGMEERLKHLLADIRAWCGQERGRTIGLARHLGVSKQALNNWLTEVRDPPAAVALELQEFMRQRRAPRKPGKNPSGGINLAA
jgi:hypothetical protein